MEIQVIIRNLSPIFSAAPGAARINLDGSMAVTGQGLPCTRARTLSVVAPQLDGSIKPVALPVVPNNTMRNLLRRTMLNEIIEPTLAGTTKLDIGAYAAAYSGNASGNPDGTPSTLDEIVEMRSHPFIGLFGGGPRMLEGRLMIDGLYPLHINAIRVIGEGFEDRLISGKITDIIWARRVDPITKLLDEEDAALIKGGTTAVNDWITKLADATKAKAAQRKKKDDDSQPEDEGADSNARGLNAFNAHEVVIPGVSWLWRINADSPTQAQVGMILQALAKMPKYQIAGGHAKGYGAFEIEDITLDGESIWFAGQLNSDKASPYLDALTEALDGMTGDAFERFAKSSKEA